MANKIMNGTNAQVLNAVRKNASLDYQNRIAPTTQANIAKTLQTLRENPLLWNEFCSVLVQRIGLTLFRQNSFENRLKPLKTGAMAYGGVVQEIGANLLKGKAYDADETNVFGAQKADVKTTYHHVDRRDVYDLRVNEDMLEEAFTTPEGLSQLVNGLLALPQQSDEWDEYLIMRNLIKTVHESEGLAVVKVDDMFADGADVESVGKQWATTLRQHYLQMKNFYNTEYNVAGMDVTSDNLVLLGTPRFFANFDVSVLAAAYHMDKAQFISDMTIDVDTFGIDGVDAALIDRDWFVCTDTKIASRSIMNPATMDIDYYFHHWGVYSASQMRNALLLSSTEETTLGSVTSKTVTKVEVATYTGETAVVATNTDIPLSVTVTYSDGSTDDAAYCNASIIADSATANTTDGTPYVPVADMYIDRQHVLHLGNRVPYVSGGKVLMVTAVAAADTTKTAMVQFTNAAGYTPATVAETSDAKAVVALEDMTKAELIAYAESIGVEVDSNATKAEILAKLQ